MGVVGGGVGWKGQIAVGHGGGIRGRGQINRALPFTGEETEIHWELETGLVFWNNPDV